ncbi:MAG: AraC family transcriptional regulator, partial [Pseudomonadota bacterium]
MSRQEIRRNIEARMSEDGLVETGIKGVQVFRVTTPVPCVPAVYEPTVVAIVSGTKEAVLDGQRYVYDSSRYLCCPMTLPVEAGTPEASSDMPLIGVMISLDPRVMTELALEMESAAGVARNSGAGTLSQGLALAPWNDSFASALLRLLQLGSSPADMAVLAQGRLRELYYAVMVGEGGPAMRRAFGVGNEIARAIQYLSANLKEPITIDDLATHVSMSRAVFHRKFK